MPAQQSSPYDRLQVPSGEPADGGSGVAPGQAGENHTSDTSAAETSISHDASSVIRGSSVSFQLVVQTIVQIRSCSRYAQAGPGSTRR